MVHIFLINSKAGHTHFSEELREMLSKRNDIQYYVIHTRKGHNETKVIEEICELFESEKMRIYCCGGSGTFCNALNGVKDISKVEMAFYPMGLTNDFLKSFGKNQKLFTNINSLIDGDVINVDYIKTNHGVCLNTFSIGLDSVMVDRMANYRQYSIFGKSAPYTMGFMYAVLLSKPDRYEVIINGQKQHGNFSEIFFGNGGTIGGSLHFDPNPNVLDGLGVYAVWEAQNSLQMVPCLNLLARGDQRKIEKYASFGYTDNIVVKRIDGEPIRMNFDGELQDPYPEWRAQIIKQGLAFVVPKGVRPIG